MRRKNVGYIRTARNDDYAIEMQKKSIEQYAKNNNFTIDYYYIDKGCSGIDFTRLELRQMLCDVKSKNITERIVVKDCSRLSRDIGYFYKIVDQVSKRNVEILSINDGETVQIKRHTFFTRIYREYSLKRKRMGQEFLTSKKEKLNDQI